MHPFIELAGRLGRASIVRGYPRVVAHAMSATESGRRYDHFMMGVLGEAGFPKLSKPSTDP